MRPHPVSMYLESTRCAICGSPASHKVAEELCEDNPNRTRHPWTDYLCCEHFLMIMGRGMDCAAQAEADMAHTAPL